MCAYKPTEGMGSRQNMTLSGSSVRLVCIKLRPYPPISSCRTWASMCWACRARFKKRLYEMRDGHLKSPDFLDVEKYPTLHFKSTRIEHVKDEEYRVTGNLTIHGVTKEVTLDVEYSGQIKTPIVICVQDSARE